MSRTSRQSLLLSIITSKDIETQDELVTELRKAGLEVTQATISRDIKELGLTKILSSSGKYKYCIVGGEEQVISNKYITIFKEAVISVKSALNIVIVKTIKGLGAGVCSFVDKLNLSGLMGATYGDDTVMLVFPTTTMASEVVSSLSDILV